MAVNKVEFGDDVLIDLSQDTLSQSSQLLNGVVGTTRTGEKVTGNITTLTQDTFESKSGTTTNSEGLVTTRFTPTEAEVVNPQEYYIQEQLPVFRAGTYTSNQTLNTDCKYMIGDVVIDVPQDDIAELSNDEFTEKTTLGINNDGLATIRFTPTEDVKATPQMYWKQIQQPVFRAGTYTTNQTLNTSNRFMIGNIVIDVPASEDNSFAFGGKNATKVATYSETFNLSDTSFVVGSTSSTSATSIKATVSNRFTSSTISIGDKDVVVVQTVTVTPTHSTSASAKAKQIKTAIGYVSYLSKRKTTDTSANTTRQVHNTSCTMIKYYNSSSVATRANATYGFYATPQAASVSSTTADSATVRASSPILYSRASSTYESTANMKCVTACTWVWNVDVYLVDSRSTVGAAVNDKLDEILCG